MTTETFKAFVLHASGNQDTPNDYVATKTAVLRMFPKLAFSWHGFREGLVDEGIPLAGATLGAGFGGLRGAALGYAGGGGISLLRSKLRGERPSMSRKLLAAGALGYGTGGLLHGGLEHLTRGATAGSLGQQLFHAPGAGTFVSRLSEEALPAAGATLGTGVAMGTMKKNKR